MMLFHNEMGFVVRRFLLMLLLLASPAAQGQPNRQPPESDPRGAVLCAWSIYVSLRAVGAACFPEQVGFNALLDEMIGRMDRFIVDNAPTTQRELDKGKAALSAETIMDFEAGPPDGKRRSCGEHPGGSAQIYRHMEQQGAARLRAEMDRLLAVPRRPVMNPCL
jgi:hypothetical protein